MQRERKGKKRYHLEVKNIIKRGAWLSLIIIILHIVPLLTKLAWSSFVVLFLYLKRGFYVFMTWLAVAAALQLP